MRHGGVSTFLSHHVEAGGLGVHHERFRHAEIAGIGEQATELFAGGIVEKPKNLPGMRVRMFAA
jgi:hypothetical protein